MWCRVKECFSLRVKGRVFSYTPSSKVIFIADEYVTDYVLRYVIPIQETVVEPEPVKVNKRGRPSNGDRENTDTIKGRTLNRRNRTGNSLPQDK